MQIVHKQLLSDRGTKGLMTPAASNSNEVTSQGSINHLRIDSDIREVEPANVDQSNDNIGVRHFSLDDLGLSNLLSKDKYNLL